MLLLSSSGVRAERDLVHQFWNAGFAVLRSPSSGGGTILPRPDLIAGSASRQKFFVLEIKTVRKDVLYISEEQVKNLVEFATRIGFEAYLGVKFKNRKKSFLFLKAPEQLEEVSRSKNYKVTFAHASVKGLSFGELIGDYQQEKLV